MRRVWPFLLHYVVRFPAGDEHKGSWQRWLADTGIGGGFAKEVLNQILTYGNVKCRDCHLDLRRIGALLDRDFDLILERPGERDRNVAESESVPITYMIWIGLTPAVILAVIRTEKPIDFVCQRPMGCTVSIYDLTSTVLTNAPRFRGVIRVDEGVIGEE
ncbi:hypothetical protein K443DRAFT_122811 [Laccaria amethystina LaAM-08-1]|uniref:Uncharacterized protein n=1 Tax=Laccaria amethystina LaAM-08-1 TaxID=1095629 RepID=A0A0C9XRW2_9AGAR|nr:hypothetical protein K443DRAFT_122811 [Laccaria amethystina LaAM-08-1]